MMTKPSPAAVAGAAVVVGAALTVVGLWMLVGVGAALAVTGVAMVAAGLIADV